MRWEGEMGRSDRMGEGSTIYWACTCSEASRMYVESWEQGALVNAPAWERGEIVTYLHSWTFPFLNVNIESIVYAAKLILECIPPDSLINSVLCCY